MAKFRPVRKLGKGLETWKDEKTRKERQKMGLLTPIKIRKSGKTHYKKEKKRKKTLERERSFLNVFELSQNDLIKAVHLQ